MRGEIGRNCVPCLCFDCCTTIGIPVDPCRVSVYTNLSQGRYLGGVKVLEVDPDVGSNWGD